MKKLPYADYLWGGVLKEGQVRRDTGGMLQGFEAFGAYSYSPINIPRQIYRNLRHKSLFTSVPSTWHMFLFQNIITSYVKRKIKQSVRAKQS